MTMIGIGMNVGSDCDCDPDADPDRWWMYGLFPEQLRGGGCPSLSLLLMVKFVVVRLNSIPLHRRMLDDRALLRVKRLYQKAAGDCGPPAEYYPHYYFEAKVDVDDIRSGFRETRGVCSALEVYPYDPDWAWTEDMMREVRPGTLQEQPPDEVRLHPLPAFVNDDVVARVETQFVLHIVRHMKARFYRNGPLKVSSTAGETLADFQSRCAERLNEVLRGELDAEQEVFARRFELIRERHGKEMEPGDLHSPEIALRKREWLRVISEQTFGLFLNSGLSSDPPAFPEPALGEPKSDMEEKLLSIHAEACRAVAGRIRALREKAGAIEEYAVHPAIRDVHVVRTCIAWMPRQDVAS